MCRVSPDPIRLPPPIPVCRYHALMQPHLIVAAIAKARRGIAQYRDIMPQLPTVNVAEDKTFQYRFNVFHRTSDS